MRSNEEKFGRSFGLVLSEFFVSIIAYWLVYSQLFVIFALIVVLFRKCSIFFMDCLLEPMGEKLKKKSRAPQKEKRVVGYSPKIAPQQSNLSVDTIDGGGIALKERK